MKDKQVTIKYSDDNHVWIEGIQFVSLNRYHELRSEAATDWLRAIRLLETIPDVEEDENEGSSCSEERRRDMNRTNCDGCVRHNTFICRMCYEFNKYVSSDECDKTVNDKITNMEIKNVIFNYPATVVLWKDGSKTVVKCDGDVYDAEKGLAMCIAKKALGNKGDYYDEIKKWLPKEKIYSPMSTGPFDQEFLWARDLADKLGLSISEVQKRCREGYYIGAVKINGMWRIPYVEK